LHLVLAHDAMKRSDPLRLVDDGPKRIPWIVAVGVGTVLGVASALAWRAEAKTNKVALASHPKPVTVVAARAEPYRVVHTYVGMLRPFIEARVGPQFLSAYVETVLVRPGAVVKRGQILGTLDCRDPTTRTAAVSAEARAIATRQLAIAHEADRTASMLDGGFVSANDAELAAARSGAEAAELMARQARLARSTLEVDDCVLRAPFDGEVLLRLVDPGSFVRPNTEMVAVVDRSTVRMTADAPESDFDALVPGTPVDVHMVAIDSDLAASITRRAPGADPGTRTVHFEVDIANADRRIPVDTTGEVRLAVGDAVPATAIPLRAVSIRESKASFFTVDRDVVHQHLVPALGEVGADVFVEPTELRPGVQVVLEGHALLKDGDRVSARAAPPEERRRRP
jgi:RND family efflux transporter MFP subunit